MSESPRGAPRAGSNGHAGGGGCVKKHKCLVSGSDSGNGAVGLVHSVHCNGVASRGSIASAAAMAPGAGTSTGGGVVEGWSGGRGGMVGTVEISSGGGGGGDSSKVPTALWLRAHLHKLLLVLVVALILLQYAFSSILEAYHLEPLFAINASACTACHPGTAHYTFVPASLTASLDGDTSASGSANASETADGGDTVTGAVQSPASMLGPSGGERQCPLVTPYLVGPYCLTVDVPPIEQLSQRFPQLEVGGAWRPKSCRARNRVAVIIPYRDRAHHLSVLLYNLHPFLQRQQLDYRIVVVEEAVSAFPYRDYKWKIQGRSPGHQFSRKRGMNQVEVREGMKFKKGSTPFNRAMLMNVGFVEALKLYDFQCFIFHDVDLIPEDDRNLYSCPEQPRHMSVAINIFRYKLPYMDIFGGVSAITKEQFQRVNGFSNMFWGWGGEDDDMFNRLQYHDFHIARYPTNIARYKMLTHRAQRANPQRHNILLTGHKRFKTDGLTSLRYIRKELNLYHTYTRVLVELVSPS